MVYAANSGYLLTQSNKQHHRVGRMADMSCYALHQTPKTCKKLSAPSTAENRADLGSNKSQAVGVKGRIEGARKHL